MNEGKVTAPREVVEEATVDNFNLVWAYIEWALKVRRFQLSPDANQAFHQVPREFKEGGTALEQLNGWMGSYLEPSVRLRIFLDIRKAQFEAAKGAVQISISEETRDLLRERKTTLFGKSRGSMEITIRHLLEVEQRCLPLESFRLLETFRDRNSLPSISESIQALMDHFELTSQESTDETKPLRREIVEILHELKTAN